MYLDSDKHKNDIPRGPAISHRSVNAIEQLGQVRAVVLLAGSVRATSLRKATDRFIIDLPIDAQRTVLDCWHDQLDDLAFELGLDHLPARVMIDRSSSVPEPSSRSESSCVQIEQDPLAFRGTGGLISDVAKEYGDDDYLILANAAQLMLTPLPRLVEAMAEMQADVTLLCDKDQRPKGLTLIRCGALRDIPSVGFVDLNEQALPAIAENHTVKVCRYDQPASMAIRSRRNYLDAVRTYHQRANNHYRLTETTPDEDWSATFGIIEPGATVDPSAVVHDSVVLAGGRVEANAVLVRAIIGPQGRVSRGKSAVECIATTHQLNTSPNQDLPFPS
jgi:hypothetical protein